MSTEIGQLSSVQAMATQERERVTRGASDTGGTRGSPPTKGVADEVKLSNNALQLQEAERRLAQQPNVDQARVTAIRDALSAGTYRVDVGRLADGLLAQERLFVAGQHQ
jgi:negative regulator of flagellin synthesis FlgM